MEQEVLEAVEGSAKKWDNVADNNGRDHGSDDCPLCELFLLGANSCNSCPVMQKTRLSGCKGSPYIKWLYVTHTERITPHGICRIAHTDEQKTIAREFASFLRSLLPQEKKKDEVYTCECGNKFWVIEGSRIKCSGCRQEYMLTVKSAEMFNITKIGINPKNLEFPNVI